MTVYALFRFDTEDFVTSESNDALLAILQTMNERRVRATFPVVGEKARFLEREDRRDVISALAPHALGYHTHLHSVHPTLPERVEPLGWREGLDALDEAERPGLTSVAEVFGRMPISYTQAGGTWLPHSHTLIARWGIPFFYTETWNSYLDVVGLPYRMGGTFGLTSPVTVMRVFDLATEGREEQARAQITQAVKAAKEAGGGMIGFVAHPTELVTTGPFWDILNFGGGVNRVPPGGPYRKPQLKSRAEVDADLRAFASLLDFLIACPDVRIITVDEYQELLKTASVPGIDDTGRHQAEISPRGLRLLARSVLEERPALFDGERHYSAIEGLQLLGGLIAQALRETEEPGSRFEGQSGKGTGPNDLGPVLPEPDDAPGDAGRERGFGRDGRDPFASGLPAAEGTIDVWAKAWEALWTEAQSRGFLPGACRVGGRGERVQIGVLLRALAEIVDRAAAEYPALSAGDALSRFARERPGLEIRVEAYDPAVQGLKPVERLHWDWPIFAPGARFDRCYAFTRAQMWTFSRLPDPIGVHEPAGGGK